ncbi:LIM domain-containing protein [Actinidia chinensis var. chinensis]|uniref:LIM domain-containing protein n=1 Tax=Actinidia chinensis var. chinensis TaxID=1590841 RepID=A0A2R6PCC6_ACTCC|nr:LIM domain-containing protein [Actinidia chinensis var. chinensis]
MAPTLTFCVVVSESKRIINAHSRHFLALSVLSLLPLSFSLIIYPTLSATLSQSQTTPTQSLLRQSPTVPDLSLQTLALPLAYSLFVFLISLSAAGTITYSTYHGFYGRPVKLASAVKSLVHTFVPLVVTTIASQFLVVLVFAALGGFSVFLIKGVEILGFEIDYNSDHFRALSIVVSIFLVLVLVYLQVNWALAGVIVVVESKWGFEPLWRSAYLVKGLRSVSLSLLLFFGFVIGFNVWIHSRITSIGLPNFGDVWVCFWFILKTVCVSSLLTMFMLHSVASNTVLYMYCKALHGELDLEIVEEFAREYVSLPFDDAKLPHVVFVA